jgi:hypothetical protein
VQLKWAAATGWSPASLSSIKDEADLVLIFGSRLALQDHELLRSIQQVAGNALLFGCSTAGEICGTQVSDDSVIVTAIKFGSTKIQGARTALRSRHDSYDAGKRLARSFQREGLSHVLVLSDGLMVNGSALTSGLHDGFATGVTISGGLAGDGVRFQDTTVMLGGKPADRTIAAVGFYGKRLQIGLAAKGGWDAFGPERLITRSDGNVLYELDGRPALKLYRDYLGEHGHQLPAGGLFFPLSVRAGTNAPGCVRTPTSVDKTRGSIAFAGDVPKGSYARLMTGNFNRLIASAGDAARECRTASPAPDFALLVSCAGRKLVLGQRIEEEVEQVRAVFPGAVMNGFYSYGEIAPAEPAAPSELLNQTMTITTFTEGR